MSNASRTEKSLLNVLTGVFGQMLSFVLSFVIRTVFIHTLGELYLGLNGLFTNILSVLNLAELGLGTAIVIELYRTVEKKDEEKTGQYLLFYRKAYRLIGAVILAAGLCLTPFLQHLIKDNASLGLINYRLVFLLYLGNTVFSYFLFAYRQSVLQANQAEYKARLITYAFKVLEMILQIIFLLCFKNIYIYLIIPLVLGCVSTVVKGVLIGKWYPF
ncbi:MAG: sugar translocase, partial [Clostridiales bacterium]|nr:sugar translocase [Clostridiales bacterium]